MLPTMMVRAVVMYSGEATVQESPKVDNGKHIKMTNFIIFL